MASGTPVDARREQAEIANNKGLSEYLKKKRWEHLVECEKAIQAHERNCKRCQYQSERAECPQMQVLDACYELARRATK